MLVHFGGGPVFVDPDPEMPVLRLWTADDLYTQMQGRVHDRERLSTEGEVDGIGGEADFLFSTVDETFHPFTADRQASEQEKEPESYVHLCIHLVQSLRFFIFRQRKDIYLIGGRMELAVHSIHI